MTESIEATAERIWRDVLNIPSGHEETTFFELDGQSISAVRIVARVEDELGVTLDVADFFDEDPDIAAFIRSVVAQTSRTPTV